MRSAIAGTKGCEAPLVSLEEGLARFKLDACCVPLQEVIKAVERAHGGAFKAQLLLQAEGFTATGWSRVREALRKVEGVKTVSEPDKVGNFKVSLDSGKNTRLGDLVNAAKSVGVTVRDPKSASS